MKSFTFTYNPIHKKPDEKLYGKIDHIKNPQTTRKRNIKKKEKKNYNLYALIVALISIVYNTSLLCNKIVNKCNIVYFIVTCDAQIRFQIKFQLFCVVKTIELQPL